MTGSGMGCPDWPKCFGSWVPPTSVDQLPENYEEEYIVKRKVKIAHLADVLVNMGMTNKAEVLLSTTKEDYSTEPFNVRKTYTEYVNRLWGALTGIFTLLTVVSSFQFRNTHIALFWYSFFGTLFVVLNGWLGSVVVDTDLLGGVVSLHFVLAFISLTFFMIAYYWGKGKEGTSNKLIKSLVVLGLILSTAQLLTGTNVREGIDRFGNAGVKIGLGNFELLGTAFNVHRLLALISGIVLIFLFIQNKNKTARPKTGMIILVTTIFVALQALTGILNIRFDFPALAQLLHVTLGSLTLVSFIYLTIQEFKSNRVTHVY